MPRYAVDLRRIESATLVVEAETEREAMIAAEREADGGAVVDWDGPYVHAVHVYDAAEYDEDEARERGAE